MVGSNFNTVDPDLIILNHELKIFIDCAILEISQFHHGTDYKIHKNFITWTKKFLNAAQLSQLNTKNTHVPANIPHSMNHANTLPLITSLSPSPPTKISLNRALVPK